MDGDYRDADESKYLILKLELDSSLSTCAVSHKSLYDEGCERFFRWLSTGIQESPNFVERRGPESSNLAQRSDSKRVWTHTVPEEPQLPSSHYPRSLDSLELSDVHMGNAGFQALVHWLESIRAQGNPKFPLTKLRLRFNEIEGTSELAKAFVYALSFSPSKNQPSSSLSSLILSNNPLSPGFKRTLFELLPQIQSLSNLHLTMTGLTTVDALALASYIAQPERRCKLVELHANSNNMGRRGVCAIVKAMYHCWTMEKVEMYANDTESDLAAGNEDDEESEEEWTAIDVDDHLITSREAITSFSIGSGCGWAVLQQNMKLVLARNVFLKRETEREALRLLKYSRLMLHPKTSIPAVKPSSQSCGDCDCVQPQDSPSFVAPSDSMRNISTSNFNWLPTEIQLSILSHLAPLLTPAQRIRIFEFAVDRNTLPSLRLCLPSADNAASPTSVSKHCIPDPENLSFNPNPPNIGSGRGKRTGSLRMQNAGTGNSFSTLRNIHPCGSGSCMGNRSVLCKRKTDRQKWLELVGCDFYDPDASAI